MRARECALICMLALGVFMVMVPARVHASNRLVPSQYGTIQAAIDASSSGDTITVSAGTYPGALTIKTSGISLLGASANTTVIDGQGTGTVVWVNASNVRVSGFTIRNAIDFGWGVHVDRANGVEISGNSISASVDGDGVNLYKANDTLVTGNSFSSNLYAVNATSSHSVRITNNRSVSDTIGVQLLDTSASVVFNNTIVDGQEGIDVETHAFGNNVTRNLIKGMVFFGIAVETGDPHALQPLFPQNNTFAENTFQRNHVGVKLQNATGNIFYHNDFFQSVVRHVQPVTSSASSVVIDSPNSWDNSSLGGVVGGNFWDDYAGVDANHDGIGDTPYVIGAGNQDSYPLTVSFLNEPVLILKVVASPSSGSAPLTVTFSATVAGSLQFSYSWSFGDGSPGSSLASPVHAFTRVGNSTVTLMVRDSAGNADSSSVVVRVLPASPVNYFLWIVGAGLAGGLVAGLVVARRMRRKREKAREQGRKERS